MKRTTIKIFSFLLSMFMTLGVQAQGPNYDTHEIIMRFVDGTPQSVQDDIMETYNLVLIDGPTPVTEFLLCKIDPYFPNLPGDFYLNAVDSINGVVEGIDNLDSEVNGIGLHYDVSSDHTTLASFTDVGVPHPLDQCDGTATFSVDIPADGTNYVRLGIYDTGIAGELEGGAFQLAFPYLFDPHFDDVNPGMNFIASNNQYPADDNGHGTTIASNIVSATTLNASLLELRAFKTHGKYSTGKLFDVIQAIDQGALENISIVNMSFSYAADSEEQDNASSPLRIAMEAAHEINGTLFIAAAGNDGSDNDNSATAAFPATFPNDYIISVASVDCDGELSSFSGYGEFSVDLAAPGENIIGASAMGLLSLVNGSSFSTAFVSRTAAQLAAHQFQFDYVPIKCAILNGATFSSSLNNKMVTNGYLDADAAYFEFINDCEGLVGGVGGVSGASGPKHRLAINENSNEFLLNHKVNNLGIDFEIVSPTDKGLQVEIFNLMGQRVKVFEFALMHGSNEINIPFARNQLSDSYFIRVKSGDYQNTIKLLR